VLKPNIGFNLNLASIVYPYILELK